MRSSAGSHEQSSPKRTAHEGAKLESAKLKLDIVRFQAGDLFLIGVVHVGVNVVFALDRQKTLVLASTFYRRQNFTYRWDLPRQVDLLLHRNLALLQRTVKIDVLNLLAEVDLLPEEGDQAILDLQEHGSTVRDLLLQGTFGFDGEGLATINVC